MSDLSEKQTVYVLRNWEGLYFPYAGCYTPTLSLAMFFDTIVNAKRYCLSDPRTIGFSIYKIEAVPSFEMMVHEIPEMKV
jgi:hypothetical protein